MPEQFAKPEKFEGIMEQAVVDALNAKGIEDAETLALVEKYIEQYHVRADAEILADPENPELPNRANIKAEIRIAVLFSKTNAYKEKALGSLNDALLSASQNTSTRDLARQIEELIDNLFS